MVGDLEGYVHWLSRFDGRLVARKRIDKSRIVSAGVLADDTIYVQTQFGLLACVANQKKYRERGTLLLNPKRPPYRNGVSSSGHIGVAFLQAVNAQQKALLSAIVFILSH